MMNKIDQIAREVGFDVEDSRLAALEEKAAKKMAKKEEREKFEYRFSYVDLYNKICINTFVEVDKITNKRTPHFVLWDGKNYKFCEEYTTNEGIKLKVPPVTETYYRNFYDRIIFPTTIVEDEVHVEELDEKITDFLQQWNYHPKEYFVVARNYIKFTWIYERFNPYSYLLIHGDYATGKSQLGRYITWLCQNGYVVGNISAAALARVIHMSGATVFMDELDKIDNNKDYEAMNSILRDGFDPTAIYQVAEADSGRKHAPVAYRIGSPKIMAKRNFIRDDALSSRVIPFKTVPMDSEIPEAMIRNNEKRWYDEQSDRAKEIINLLLKWRWQNIFKYEAPKYDMRVTRRTQDLMMGLLKVATKEDRLSMNNYIITQERMAKSAFSEERRIMIIRFVNNLVNKNEGLFSASTTIRLFITDILDEAKKDVGDEMSEYEFKKIWTSRNIKRELMNTGFILDEHRNKYYIKSESLKDLLPRLKERYNIKDDSGEEGQQEDTSVDNLQDNPIDNSNDKSKIDNII